MTTKMHELLRTAVTSQERLLGDGHTFAQEHAAPVRRAIQVRRVATYAGTGTVVAVASLGTAYGLQQWSAGALSPASGPRTTAGETATAESLATKVNVALVPVPIDPSVYRPGEATRPYVYYASLGATDMVPFPASGIWYPGIPDVPSDAVIVSVTGDATGYNFDAPGSEDLRISAWPAWTDMYDFGGDSGGPYGSHMEVRTAQASVGWDVIGQVSSTTKWGIHYFLVDGNVVTEVEGRSNPDAIEVTAMFDPQNGS